MHFLPYPDSVLCFVRDIDNASMFDCWFTTQALADQWGDDWDDAPYEHNAESPHGGSHHQTHCVRIEWDGYCTPATEVLNSAYSVRDINGGAAPWFAPAKWHDADRNVGGVCIAAGMTLRDFVAHLYAAGGCVLIEAAETEIAFKEDAPRG